MCKRPGETRSPGPQVFLPQNRKRGARGAVPGQGKRAISAGLLHYFLVFSGTCAIILVPTTARQSDMKLLTKELETRLRRNGAARGRRMKQAD